MTARHIVFGLSILCLAVLLEAAQATGERAKDPSSSKAKGEAASSGVAVKLPKERLADALGRSVSCSFDGRPLEDVCEFLATVSGAKIVLARELLDTSPRLTLEVQHRPLINVVVAICYSTRLHLVLIDGVIYLEPDSDKEEREHALTWEKLTEPTTVSLFAAPLLEQRAALERVCGFEVVVGERLAKRNLTISLIEDATAPIDAVDAIAKALGASWSIEGGVVSLEDFVPKDVFGWKRLGRMVTFSFNNTPLKHVVEFLSAVSDVTLTVDGEVAGGVPITMRLDDVCLAAALRLIARQAGVVVIFGEGAGEVRIRMRPPEHRGRGPAQR